MNQPDSPFRTLLWVALSLALLIGSFLRVSNFEKPIDFRGSITDEVIYGRYVEQLGTHWLTTYPAVVENYLIEQENSPLAILPPTRVTFLASAASWQAVFGGRGLEAVRSVSTAASVLLLLLSALIAWRMAGPPVAVGVTALMAVAPTQIYMAHRALLDGFFALLVAVCLWSLWETLRQPRRRWWLVTYGVSLALLVLTKENAAFVYVAILGILIVHRWMHIGTITGPLLVVTVLAPLLGVLGLIYFAGGWEPLREVYALNVERSYHLTNAIRNGDGPWFRYLSDLLLTSPAVLLLAIGGAFLSRREPSGLLFFLAFIIFSYLLMANLRFGMNLRYANMWDLPLRMLAVIPLLHLARISQHPRVRRIIFACSLVVVMSLEFGNYLRLFVSHQIYDPVPLSLMQALDMIK